MLKADSAGCRIMNRIQRQVTLGVLTLCLFSSGAFAQGSRDISAFYSQSRALVIGIDDYTNGWPDLDMAIEDAERVADALEAHGFTVRRLIDPTTEELRDEIRRFYVVDGVDPEARLFLWYAGHGYTRFGEGYLIGSDAPLPDDPNFLIHALHMRDIGSMVRLAQSKHALAVFDSCFSGTIFTTQRALPSAEISLATLQPVRQFITSGEADQLVSDDGVFRALFLAALSGEERADFNNDGYITGSELGMFLEGRVTNLTEAAQTPRSGKLRDPRFDGGDFVFEAKTARGLHIAPSQSQTEADAAEIDPVELTFWDTIKDSTEPSDYLAYLEVYPDGRFAPLAHARSQRVPLRSEAPQESETSSVVLRDRPDDAGRPERQIGLLERDILQDRERLANAFVAYPRLESLGVLASGNLGAEAIEFDRIFVVRAEDDVIIANIDLSVRTAWGHTMVSDTFTLRRTSDGFEVSDHGRTLLGGD